MAGLMSLVLSAGAQATPYYATPSPMMGATCGSADPCSLTAAVLAATNDGDEVLLGSGTYPITADLQITDAIRMAPRASGFFPQITNSGGFKVSLNDTATLEDLTIIVTGLAVGAPAVDLQQGTGKRLYVIADGASSEGVSLAGGTIADSGVWHKGNFGAALKTGAGSAGSNRIRNVTAVGTGAMNPVGLLATPYPGSVSNTVKISNSILMANTGTQDFRSFGMGAGTVTLDVDHSNFDNPNVLAGSVLNDLGGNQTALPLLSNVALGIFAQTTGSPTIDGGAKVADLGPLDFDAQPRCMGTEPDIGADEFAGSLCPVPIATTATAATPAATAPTKKKCKRKTRKRSVIVAKKKKCKKRKK
jgi:hypothetical protein